MKPGAVSRPFGALLRKHRAASGLSQEELADRAGLSAAAIGALERGRRRAPYEVTVVALADALELAPEQRAALLETAKRTRGRSRHVSVTATASSGAGAVPAFISSFVGRIEELAILRAMLAENRLVTITGSGGVGKTRIACELLGAVPTVDERRIAYVDLAPIADQKLVIGIIANSLGVDGADSQDQLLTALWPQKIVLVLDNCEHLIQTVATIARAIFQRCPGVSILATSRIRLGLLGEAVYRLPSLDFPLATQVAVVDAVRYAAVELFIERTKSVDPRYKFTDVRVSVTADICRTLSGIPLAIELAAARVPFFGLVDIRARLFEQFLLTDGVTGLPERQRTMTATIAWSYNLLSDLDRTLMRRLSIFADGFTLRAAEFVCVDSALAAQDVPLHLARLVDACLINANTDQDAARYGFAEATRRFALERISESHEYEATARRHAQWLAALAARAWGPSNATRIEIVQEATREFVNIGAAIEWCLASDCDDDVVIAGSILGGLRFLWSQSFRRLDFRRLVEETLRRIDRDRHVQIVADLYRGLIQTWSAADVDEDVLRAATTAFDQIGDYAALVFMNSHLIAIFLGDGDIVKAQAAATAGYAFIANGNLEGSRAHIALLIAESDTYTQLGQFEEGRSNLRQARNFNERHNGDQESYRLVRLVRLEATAGDLPLATQLALEGLRYTATLPETPSRAFIIDIFQQHAAILYALQGDVGRAAELVSAPAQYVLDLPHLHYVQWTLQTVSTIAALRLHSDVSAKLLGYINASLAEARVRRDSLSHLSYDQCLTTLRACYTEAELEALQAEGARFTFMQACDEALGLLADTR